MEENQTKKQKGTNYLVPLSILVAGVIIAAGFYLGGVRASNHSVANQQASTLGGTEELGTNIQIPAVSNSDHILGNPNAKIVMVEYSDLECPYCKIFHTTLHKILDTFGKNGDVAWVYREFPISELHPKAPKEAEAAECANDQGGNDAFWKFIDTVYEVTPSNNGLDEAQLPKIAGDIGLNVNTFNTCVSSGKFTDKVASERADAIKAGGQGTPYTILVSSQGKLPISQGAISYEQLSSLITQILNSN